MRTIETVVYKFDELSEEAKKKAIEGLADINVDEDWSWYIYEDAENIGLKITGFDLDRANYCKAEFMEGAENCANLIIANHGETCDSYNTAKEFLNSRYEIVKKYSDTIGLKKFGEDDSREFFEESLDTLEYAFRQSLSKDYLSSLKREYDYKTSEEAIVETIKANDYEFTDEGKLV